MHEARNTLPTQPSDSSGGSLEVTTVYETGSLALFGLAKALLEAAGIPFLSKNDLGTDLVGGLRFGGMPSLVTGPMQLQVRRDDASVARELLADIQEGTE